MTNCNKKISQYPEYTGITPNTLIFPVVDTGVYSNFNLPYDTLMFLAGSSLSGSGVSNLYLSGDTTLVIEKNGGGTIQTSLLPILNYEHYISAGTYSSGYIYFSGYGINFLVDVNELLDDTNTFVTGGTLSGTTLILSRNDGVNIYIDESYLDNTNQINSLSDQINAHTGDTNNPHQTTLANLLNNQIINPQDDDIIIYSGGSWINFANSTRYTSAGIKVSYEDWADNGDGTLYLPNLMVSLYDSDDGSGYLHGHNIISGITGVNSISALTNHATSYVVISHQDHDNAGYAVINDVNLINETTVIPYLTVYRENNWLHILEWDSLGNALTNKLNMRFVKTQRLARESGLAISTSANTGTITHGDAITITAGIAWNGGNRYSTTDLNQNYEDTTTYLCYLSGGTTWFINVITGTTGFNNTQYNNPTTGLVALSSSNRYNVNWVYRGIEQQKHVYLILGQNEYTSVAAAQSGELAPTSLPEIIRSHAILVGRIIGKYQTPQSQNTTSAFVTTFSMSSVGDHNMLSSLQGGEAGQYYHLTQSEHTNLIGGTDASSLHHHNSYYPKISDFNYHTGDTTIHYTKNNINLNELGSSAHTHTTSDIVGYVASEFTGNTSATSINELYVNTITIQAANFQQEYDNGNSGSTKQVDWINSTYQKITLTEDCTITMTPIAYGVSRLQLKIIQGSGGGHNLLFTDTVIFPNGAFDFTTGVEGEHCIITMYYDGIRYIAVPLPYYSIT